LKVATVRVWVGIIKLLTLVTKKLYVQYIFIKFLRDVVVDINRRDSSGNTPLHEAVEADVKSSIDFLLTHGADPTITNNRHMAPIHLAVELNKPGALEVLMSLGK
jgi:ankyrin repeat protein